MRTKEWLAIYEDKYGAQAYAIVTSVDQKSAEDAVQHLNPFQVLPLSSSVTTPAPSQEGPNV